MLTENQKDILDRLKKNTIVTKGIKSTNYVKESIAEPLSLIYYFEHFLSFHISSLNIGQDYHLFSGIADVGLILDTSIYAASDDWYQIGLASR